MYCGSPPLMVLMKLLDGRMNNVWLIGNVDVARPASFIPITLESIKLSAKLYCVTVPNPRRGILAFHNLVFAYQV